MNTKNRQDRKKNQREKTQPKKGPQKQGQNPNMLHHDHEHPETRLTR